MRSFLSHLFKSGTKRVSDLPPELWSSESLAYTEIPPLLQRCENLAYTFRKGGKEACRKSKRPIQPSLSVKRCAWRRPAASRLPRSLANEGFQTPRFTSGAKNWLLMAQKPFQAVVIRRFWRKRIAGACRELERTRQERDILKKTVGLFAHDQW